MSPKANPTDYRYSKDHEWFSPSGNSKGAIGITDYAQAQLGDIVFLDLPAPGKTITQFKKMGEIESVKAVSDLFAPVSGTVIEINQNVINDPALVNSDPYGAGWLIKIKPAKPDEANNLLSAADYEKLIGEGA